MPDDSTGCIGLAALFHPLKSPMTATRSALGAQTANEAPPTPFWLPRGAPGFWDRSEVRPSLNRYRSFLVRRLMRHHCRIMSTRGAWIVGRCAFAPRSTPHGSRPTIAVGGHDAENSWTAATPLPR